MRRTQGHTLLELLVVVAILMVLAAIAMPSSSDTPDRKLDTTQLAMQDALDRAQSLATTTAAVFGVRFDIDDDWFCVIDENGVPVDDPLSHKPYLVKLALPGEPPNVYIDSVDFNGHVVAVFNEKGVMQYGGQVHLRCSTTLRWLSIDTASGAFTEIPVSG
jgi:pilin/secretion family protein with methylation motif